MVISKCGKYLVLASLSNNVVIFTKGEEKLGRRTMSKWIHHMTLPQYNFPAATLTIHPKQTNQLVITYTNNKLIVYDMEEFEFLFSAVISSFNRRLRYHINQNLVCNPERTDMWLLQAEREVLCVTRLNNEEVKNGNESGNDSAEEDRDSAGVLLKRHKNQRLLVDANGVAKKKKKKQGGKAAAKKEETTENGQAPADEVVNGTDDAEKVRKLNYSTKVVKEANVSIQQTTFVDRVLTSSSPFFALQHLVHLSWLGEDELVSVELRPEVLLEQLPPTLKLKKYGTG